VVVIFLLLKVKYNHSMIHLVFNPNLFGIKGFVVVVVEKIRCHVGSQPLPESLSIFLEFYLLFIYFSNTNT
jgi:hypothetical protein